VSCSKESGKCNIRRANALSSEALNNDVDVTMAAWDVVVVVELVLLLVVVADVVLLEVVVMEVAVRLVVELRLLLLLLLVLVLVLVLLVSTSVVVEVLDSREDEVVVVSVEGS